MVHVLKQPPNLSRPSEDASSLDVKHSTFKNVKSFLKAATKEGLIKVKETKGDIVITGDDALQLFRVKTSLMYAS